MPITQSDIKLMASQELTDRDDAGGRMTGNEVPDGSVNNLFPDISRLDRVYGRVSMRKCFPFVDTADQSTYYGAHAILTDPPDDPLVSVTMFSEGDPTDRREDARDRVEQYVIQGPRATFFLMGLHPAGMRTIVCWQPVGWGQPKVGEVLFLRIQTGVSQYVRITEIESERRT
ncbi:MAG: hypothetical protein EOM25_10635, partial [Deltaproteobacteria bacterium]|nr:hypothetical protein [Deltaproteobacteria bacterium]